MKEWLFVLFALYLLGGVILMLSQRHLLYHPTPVSAGGEYYRIHGVRIHVLSHGREHERAILYFGGNAERLDTTLDHLRPPLEGYALYLPNYRGYGGSEGESTQEHLYADALSLYDSIKAHHPHILIMGRSLGTAMASYVARHRAVDGLILITPFETLRSVAEEKFPYYPIAWMLYDHYDTLSLAPHIHTPTLILIAADDTLIPPHHAHTLAQAIDGAQTQILESTDHSSIHYHPTYYPIIRTFVRSCMP